MHTDGLASVGRARRERTDAGERWILPEGCEAIVERLVALGHDGVGGFSADPRDARAAIRLDVSCHLGSWWSDGAREPHDVLARMVPVARALRHCERRSLFPGPLGYRGVWLADRLDGAPAGLVADPLVESIVGASARPAGESVGRWTPPGPARGERWDAVANRYVFGLLLYRALAGCHPFEGRGRRLELADGAQRGAPPMPESVARTLPPGLQSLCLRLLAPEPSERPCADQLVEALQEFASPRAISLAPPMLPQTAPETIERPPPGGPRRDGRWRVAAAMAPAVVALGLAAAIRPEPPGPSEPLSVDVATVAPLSPDTMSADDCARCHPEHAAQWHGSVMAHSVKSPLFGALEILIQEQVGRDFECPGGAGVLREAGAGACRDANTGLLLTGAGGELWCVNCHAPEENLREAMPPWDGRASSSATRSPVVDLLPKSTLEGISCAFCHQVDGPARPGNRARGEYEGNPDWVSPISGQRFFARPEDRRGRPGIGNSGYHLDPRTLLSDRGDDVLASGAHRRPPQSASDYLSSSEFCGACHDVRLFGTDARAGGGEHFKRLRNAYSEWVDWSQRERSLGREPASCQDCHMSLYPGVCVPDDGARVSDPFSGTRYTALERACPQGTRFDAREPGARPQGRVSIASEQSAPIASHAFTGVDVPLSSIFPEGLVDDPGLDAHGTPRGVHQRRDLLLGATFRFELGEVRRGDSRLSLPIEIENVGAGHKVPAGFSQEREIWVHLRVTDQRGHVVHEVGGIDGPAENLRDKVFDRVNVDDRFTDALGRPLGVFGADIRDGPDVPRWRRRGDEFVGGGLINLQNGFLRCVRCIGEIDARGECQPGPGQGLHRADKFADGVYDLDTGECTSNLVGEAKFLETYFPVGALDATRGVVRGPDAIIDERSAVAGEPQRYRYELRVPSGPLTVEARLMFRAFPPFLVEAFADYEALQAARGLRPSGPLVTREMLGRLEVVELAVARVQIP